MANVSYSPEVLARLREWARVAVSIGLRAEFVAALREMEARLQSDPELWGDPLWDYRTLRLTLYRRYGPVLMTYYVAHADGLLVLVREVELTPGSLLADLLG